MGRVMDIVLPLLAADIPRYVRLQRPTLERFYADLETTWIYARADELQEVRRGTAGLDRVNVMSELDLVPELKLVNALRRDVSRGWYQQQLIKLAAVARVETPFALLLDADVVAVRDVCDADLLPLGRAIRHREPVAYHPQWVSWAGAALDLEPLAYSAQVTPSALARDAVRDLAAYAGDHIKPKKWILRVASATPGVRKHLKTWRGRLLSRLPWTEYQLYETFLVRTGAFDKFHSYRDDIRMYGNCVWDCADFDAWDPVPSEDTPIHFFSVIQGHCRFSIDAVETKLKHAGILRRD